MTEIIEPPEPPSAVPYGELDDFRNRELLQANGIALSEEALVSTLERGEGVLEAAVIHVLGSGEHRSAIPPLRERLGSDDDLIRVEAANALARMGCEEGHSALLDSLALPIDAYIAAPLAAGFLARLDDPSGYAVLVGCLRSPNLAIRMIACKQITYFVPSHGMRAPGGEEIDVYGLVATALRDTESDVRWQALVQLAWIDSPESRALLRAQAEEGGDDDVRQLSRRALAGAYGSIEGGESM